MKSYLNPVIVFLATVWLPDVLLSVPAYPFENSSTDPQADVELLNTKIAELQMTVSALVNQVSTLSTAVITLQTQSMAASGAPQNAVATVMRKAEDVSAVQEPIAGQAMRVTPQKHLEEPTLSPQMVDYRFLGHLYQSGTQRAFIGRGRDIFIVSVGEIVDSTLEVLAIDVLGVKVRDTRSQAEMTLSQGQAKPGQS
jgi:hypothetical protein